MEVDKSVVEVFWEVRNALVAGAVWCAGIFLLLGTRSSWWSNPLPGASEAVRVLINALGPPGLTIVMLAFMALVGNALIRFFGSLWSRWRRVQLMYSLRGVSDSASVKLALNRLTLVGLRTRSYSNRSLSRLVEAYEGQLAAKHLAPPTEAAVRTLASNTIFMAPALLTSSEKRFTEQQRASARCDLAVSLIFGFPLLAIELTVNTVSPLGPRWAGYVLGVIAGIIAYRDAQSAWRERNSQIAHALVDLGQDLTGISQNWDVSGGLKSRLPHWLGRAMQRD